MEEVKTGSGSHQGWWERKTGEKLKMWEKIVGTIMLILFLFIFYITLDANKYQAQVRAIEGEGKVGVNPTTERLDFGDLSRGTTAARSVKVENQTFLPFLVSVIRFGGINDLTKLNRNHFIVRPGESAKLEFTLFMPASAQVDETYNGRIFIFKIPAPFF